MFTLSLEVRCSPIQLFCPATEYGTLRLHCWPYHPPQERIRDLPYGKTRRLRNSVVDPYRTFSLSACVISYSDYFQYFALSGLKTNLGLLDNGITWGYVVLLCVVAFVGKFIGCAAAARACKFTIRECGAIGTLMSCKGYTPSLSNN